MQPHRRIALVIGNGNYLASVLANPENDARAMEAVLKRLGFDVYKYENLDQGQIKKAIDEFGTRLRYNDVGLFYYAGHGIQSNGYNYLIPVDARLTTEKQVEYDCVQADRILALMEGSGTKVNIIILDACRNNPFERSWNRSATTKGLAFMNAPKGTLIAYATSPGSTASDGSGEHGLYTQAILESILIPNITILQMFQQVRSIVSQKSNDRQTPWESTSLIGDFYFSTGEIDSSKVFEKIQGTPLVSLPTLNTLTISNISSNGASSGGAITNIGGAKVIARGICWSNTTNPIITINKTSTGTGADSFTSELTGLMANTKYYVRAYATNSAGTAYGNEVSFTTSAGISVISTLSTTEITSITSTTAKSGGIISSDGGASATAVGVCWSTSTTPTITNNKTIDRSRTESFVSSLTRLTANTTYYVRAYATNSAGTAYGSEFSFTTSSEPTTVTDVEGNVYRAVIIGNQVWMAENLKTTK